MKTCARCGEQFQAKEPSRPSTYCSKSCALRTGVTFYTDVCGYCETSFEYDAPRANRRRKYCSRSCASRAMVKSKGAAHSSWRGQPTRLSSGYLQITTPDGRTLREHRYVMEQSLGRRLLPGENVHHRNGKRDDNRLQNLELWVVWQPPGQRIEDVLAWAKEVLIRYEPTWSPS